jgi:putative nucleotidyltransferase with HDIG domain
VSAGLQAAREALAGEQAWLVGGAVRDRLLGRDTLDVDVVVKGDPERAARAIARAGGRAACFSLSEEFGSWRVVARGGAWQVDVERLRGATIEADLRLRDFTVNAIAQELAGETPIDPLGGIADLDARTLRMAGPGAFADDPLRVLRMVRAAVELDFRPEQDTVRCAAAHAGGLSGVSGERVFMELRRIIAAEDVLRGIEMLGEVGALAVVLPEIEALKGVQQSHFHHLDVYEHTLAVLSSTAQLTAVAASAAVAHPAGPPATGGGAGAGGDPGQTAELTLGLGEHGQQAAHLMAQPLADGMTRAEALRWGALLHDVAKPATRAARAADGRVTFIGHDSLGADMARALLGRLRASERLRAHVAALVRNHLRLGFLVHEPQPLSRRTVFSYLRACTPVEVDVTMLSLADRVATRGHGAERAIAAHVDVACGLLGDALRWSAEGPPHPLLRGDELAREIELAPGPRVGEMLERLAEAQYAGEISTREQALTLARQLAPTLRSII